MFGYPCAFVNGNMFTGVFQTSVFVRLSDDALQELFRSGESAPFEPMPGRAMKGYALVPESVVAEPRSLRSWIERSLEYSLTMPVKEKKPRAAKAKKATAG